MMSHDIENGVEVDASDVGTWKDFNYTAGLPSEEGKSEGRIAFIKQTTDIDWLNVALEEYRETVEMRGDKASAEELALVEATQNRIRALKGWETRREKQAAAERYQNEIEGSYQQFVELLVDRYPNHADIIAAFNTSFAASSENLDERVAIALGSNAPIVVANDTVMNMHERDHLEHTMERLGFSREDFGFSEAVVQQAAQKYVQVVVDPDLLDQTTEREASEALSPMQLLRSSLNLIRKSLKIFCSKLMTIQNGQRMKV